MKIIKLSLLTLCMLPGGLQAGMWDNVMRFCQLPVVKEKTLEFIGTSAANAVTIATSGVSDGSATSKGLDVRVSERVTMQKVAPENVANEAAKKVVEQVAVTLPGRTVAKIAESDAADRVANSAFEKAKNSFKEAIGQIAENLPGRVSNKHVDRITTGLGVAAGLYALYKSYDYCQKFIEMRRLASLLDVNYETTGPLPSEKKDKFRFFNWRTKDRGQEGDIFKSALEISETGFDLIKKYLSDDIDRDVFVAGVSKVAGRGFGADGLINRDGLRTVLVAIDQEKAVLTGYLHQLAKEISNGYAADNQRKISTKLLVTLVSLVYNPLAINLVHKRFIAAIGNDNENTTLDNLENLEVDASHRRAFIDDAQLNLNWSQQEMAGLYFDTAIAYTRLVALSNVIRNNLN